MNTKSIYNRQYKKVLNTLPINDFIIFLKKNKSILYGKTALEVNTSTSTNTNNITLPYYVYNIDLYKNDIYLFIIKIAKKYRFIYNKQYTPYSLVYSLKEIPIFHLINIKFNIPTELNHMINLHIIDIYFNYIHNYNYNNINFQNNLNNFNNIDNKIKCKVIKYNINQTDSYDKYLSYFNKSNYINTGVNAFNIHMNKNISGILTILLINEDQEIKKNKNKLIFKKEKCTIYYFNYYYNVYDIKYPDIVIMQIFILKRPINIIEKYNITTPHGTLFFLAINYFIYNDIYYYYLFNDLLCKLHNTQNILTHPKLKCFTNNNLKNFFKYFYNKLYNNTLKE